MSKPIFKILRGGSENTFESVELDWESRRYVHVNVKNVHQDWDANGSLRVTNTSYDLERCKEEFFQNTEFELQYFQERRHEFLYCM